MEATIIELRGLEAVVEVTNRYGLPQGDKRPCVMALLNRGHSEYDTPPARDATFMCAVELKRQRVSKERALEIISAWDKHNIPPRPPQALKGCVKSAWEKDYHYSCSPRGKGKGLAGTIYCIGHDLCPYYRQSGQVSVSDYGGPWMIYAAGWHRQLKSSEREVYVAIQLAERWRKMKPGSTVFISHEDLGQLVGLHRNTVSPALKRLNEKGLIELKMGQPLGRGKEATEIVRVLPIPAPSPCSPSTILVQVGSMV